MATKFVVGDYVRFAPGAELGRYPVTDPSEWNANSAMTVTNAEEIAGKPDRFTVMRENTLIGTFDGKQLVKVEVPANNPAPPDPPDRIDVATPKEE